MLAWMLFVNPMVLNKWQQAILLLPLCLAISLVYKTTKCDSVRKVPLAAAGSWLTIVVGMYLVGGATLLIHRLFM